jgi:hypothetical protein
MKYTQATRDFLKRFDSYLEKCKKESDPELRALKLEAMSRALNLYARTI